MCRDCLGETLGASDAGGQLRRLQRLEADHTVRLTLSECLDECDRGDVVVARPAPAGRRAARPVWFARLAGDGPTEELGGWLAAGGPGAAPVPAALRPLRIRHDETAG